MVLSSGRILSAGRNELATDKDGARALGAVFHVGCSRGRGHQDDCASFSIVFMALLLCDSLLRENAMWYLFIPWMQASSPRGDGMVGF